MNFCSVDAFRVRISMGTEPLDLKHYSFKQELVFYLPQMLFHRRRECLEENCVALLCVSPENVSAQFPELSVSMFTKSEASPVSPWTMDGCVKRYQYANSSSSSSTRNRDDRQSSLPSFPPRKIRVISSNFYDLL